MGNARKGTDNSRKKLLVLTCPICGHVNDTPLSIASVSKHIAEWAKIAAYENCMSFCSEDVKPKNGDELNIQVKYPVCCKEGEVFVATHGYNDAFYVMRLLNIKKYKEHTAKLHVRILSVGNRLSYVEKVTEEEKQGLRENQTYHYVAPCGDSQPQYGYISKDIACFRNSFGGDVWYEDYVFTDTDGIDHLVQSCYKDFDKSEAYFGDKVLGYHLFSPYFPPSVLLKKRNEVQDVKK